MGILHETNTQEMNRMKVDKNRLASVERQQVFRGLLGNIPSAVDLHLPHQTASQILPHKRYRSADFQSLLRKPDRPMAAANSQVWTLEKNRMLSRI